MKTVTLYDAGCTPCKRKALWKSIKAKAREKQVLLARLDITKDQSAKQKANVHYAMGVPFIEEDGVATEVDKWLA